MRNENTLRVEGNNGGDYFEITPVKEGRVLLRVGSCCVNVYEGIVPIEFLTSLVDNVLQNFGTVEGYLQSTNWDGDFTRKLIKKCEPVSTVRYETGYFATHNNKQGKVHIVRIEPHDAEPICGVNVRGEYQWCSHGAYMQYVNCQRCRGKWLDWHERNGI